MRVMSRERGAKWDVGRVTMVREGRSIVLVWAELSFWSLG
jgi:hypothetical protein